ncbi:MAG: CDP-alcohol phosphatidyltransferase family protein [Candidatus Omnitrophica bacterium]|nr:CDP-alcohol phosphatidyltransferase family protein [Candidatus Omnitrophota bacterium]MCA9432147.1 CDP-alcohol phosphatidyltransferase family protein [Candidatus Omnitrophota bacterium]
MRLGYLRYLNLANLISLLRLILLPVFFYFLIYYIRWSQGDTLTGVTQAYYYITLSLVPIILLTDFLDGWVARRFDMVSPLGAFLDPLADKFFAFSAIAILAYVNELPVWLAMAVFFKEFFILNGWILLFILGYDTEISPSKIGKTAAVCQGIVVFAVILTLPEGKIFDFSAFPLYSIAELIDRPWFHIFTAGITGLAGIQYIVEGLHRAQRVVVPETPPSENVAILKVEGKGPSDSQ